MSRWWRRRRKRQWKVQDVKIEVKVGRELEEELGKKKVYWEEY